MTCTYAYKLMEHIRKLDLSNFRSNFCADLRPPKKNYFFRSMDRSINRSITEIIYNGNLPSHWGLVPCLNPPFCLFKTDLSKKKNCDHLKFLLRFLRVFSDFRDLFWSSLNTYLKILPGTHIKTGA